MNDENVIERPIWDIGVRLFHWTLVACLALLWLTGENGEWLADRLAQIGLTGVDPMTWHVRTGYTVLGLLVFRLIWGFLGSATARFSSFLRHPRDIIAYLRGQHPHRVGHNPAGGWMVVAMLVALSFQVVTGLFARDDYGFEAPWAHFVSEEVSDALLELHEGNFNLLLALVGLHIAAILFYALFRRDNLVRPMLTGRKALPANLTVPPLAGRVRILACALLAAGLAYALTR